MQQPGGSPATVYRVRYRGGMPLYRVHCAKRLWCRFSGHSLFRVPLYRGPPTVAQIYSKPRNLGIICTLYSTGESVQCIHSLLYVLDNNAVTHNTSRRTAAGRLIALLVHLLTTVAWYTTRSSTVSDLHNHTNEALRPQRAMRTELSVQAASNDI